MYKRLSWQQAEAAMIIKLKTDSLCGDHNGDWYELDSILGEFRVKEGHIHTATITLTLCIRKIETRKVVCLATAKVDWLSISSEIRGKATRLVADTLSQAALNAEPAYVVNDPELLRLCDVYLETNRTRFEHHIKRLDQQLHQA